MPKYEPPMNKADRKRLIVEGLIGGELDNILAYRESASYHAWVDFMAMSLIEMSDAMSKGGIAFDGRDAIRKRVADIERRTVEGDGPLWHWPGGAARTPGT